jgi:hypothetical protein
MCVCILERTKVVKRREERKEKFLSQPLAHLCCSCFLIQTHSTDANQSGHLTCIHSWMGTVLSLDIWSFDSSLACCTGQHINISLRGPHPLHTGQAFCASCLSSLHINIHFSVAKREYGAHVHFFEPFAPKFLHCLQPKPPTELVKVFHLLDKRKLGKFIRL